MVKLRGLNEGIDGVCSAARYDPHHKALNMQNNLIGRYRRLYCIHSIVIEYLNQET
jgi:hypothetical protein